MTARIPESSEVGKRVTKSFRLPEGTAMLLQAAVDGGLASSQADHIVAICATREREEREAAAKLRALGWSRKDLEAAVEALRYSWPSLLFANQESYLWALLVDSDVTARPGSAKSPGVSLVAFYILARQRWSGTAD